MESSITKTTTEQGKLFEKLTKKILKFHPQFTQQFKEVYLWSEFNTKFNLHLGDIGIDLMALTHNNEWASIQCKCYNPSHILQQEELKQFFSHNTINTKDGEFVCQISEKILFHTCKLISKNIELLAKNSQTSDCQSKIFGFYDIEDLNIDFSTFNKNDLDELKLQGKKSLRSHQLEAIKTIRKHYLEENNPRGKVIMACGTGKSLLAIRTIDTFLENNEIAVFFAPSLALIKPLNQI